MLSAPFQRFRSLDHVFHALELVYMDTWLLWSRPRMITRNCDIGLRGVVGEYRPDGLCVYHHAPSDSSDMRHQVFVLCMNYSFSRHMRMRFLAQCDAMQTRVSVAKTKRAA